MIEYAFGMKIKNQRAIRIFYISLVFIFLDVIRAAFLL